MNEVVTPPTLYQREVALICHELERFSHISVIEAVLNNMVMERTDDRKGLLRLPWVQLFLLKLSMVGGSGSLPISVQTFGDLAQRLYNLQHLASDLSHPDILREVRPMLLQQIWYQQSDRALLVRLFRQSMFFSASDSWYSEAFLRETGVSLESFYVITFTILLEFRSHKYSALHINLVSLICHLCPRMPVQELFNYFRLVGVKVSDLPAYMRGHALKGYPVSEYYQDSPLKSKPILIEAHRLLALDYTLFQSGMVDLVPTALKKIPGFKDHFGEDFQKYVGRLLQRLGGIVLDSAVVEKIYRNNGWNGLNADFVVVWGNGVLVVECKAVEPSPVVRTSADPDVLKSNLQANLIKGTRQIVRTANLLSSLPEYCGLRCYGLVVTHWDFGIFDAGWIANEVDMSLRSSVQGEFPDSVLSLEQVVYCTVDDVEDLTRAFALGCLDVIDIFEGAVEDQRKYESRRMTFNQVISKHLARGQYKESEVFEEMRRLLKPAESNFKSNRVSWVGSVEKLIRVHESLMATLNVAPLRP